MASDELTAPVIGKVQSELELQGRKYPNVTFGVILKLCADIVLGQSFLNIHKEVIFKLGGPLDKLIVSKDNGYCGVSASKLEAQRLYSKTKPIATRSHRFNDSDKLFIKEEIRKLLNDGVIEPSYRGEHKL